MAEMKFTVNCCWNKKSGFKDYTTGKVASTVPKKVSNKVKAAAKKSKKVQKVKDVEMEEPEELEEELELN